jgi:hypothetical protein
MAAGIAGAVMFAAVFDTLGLGFAMLGGDGLRSVSLDGATAMRFWIHWVLAAVHAGPWSRDLAVLAQYGLAAGFLWRAKAVLAAAVIIGGVVFALLLAKTPKKVPHMIHVRGLRLREDEALAVEKANKDMEPGIAHMGPGIPFAPGVTLPYSWELLGIWVVGAPGSGKTQFIRYVIDGILERRRAMLDLMGGSEGREPAPLADLPVYPDRIICMDAGKGDFTEAWPEGDFIFVAPHDTGKRMEALSDGTMAEREYGYAWDIANDIVGLPAALDFADRMIEETKEPVWGEGARAIFVGMIRGLQIQYDRLWSWRHLDAVMKMDAVGLEDYIGKHYPEASAFVLVTAKGQFSKQSEGYIASLKGGVGVLVSTLARAWGDGAGFRKIAFTEWMLDPNPLKKTIILQRSGEVAKISSSWIGAAIAVMGRMVTSPRLTDDPKRRIWLILDEAAQTIAKDDPIQRFIEVGRSRGLATIFGFQTDKQTEIKWSPAEAANFLNMMQVKLVFRLPLGPAAKWMSEELIGSSDWEIRDISRSTGSGKGGTISWKKERQLVVLPNYFQSKLGPRGSPVLDKAPTWSRGTLRALGTPQGGVFGFYVGGEDLCRLRWPFVAWAKRRAGTVAADWVYSNKD